MFDRMIICTLVVVSSLSVWLAGCDGPGEPGTDTGGSTGSTGGSTGSSGEGGSGGVSTGSTSSSSSTGGGPTGSTTSTETGGANPVKYCTVACQSAADCVSDSGAYSSDNWECTGGSCVYTGCKTNTECATSFPGKGYVCAYDPAVLHAYCTGACQSAADCASDSGAYGSDNFACSGGGCIYTGCKTNTECATSFPGKGYVCAYAPAFDYSYCTSACQSAADCASDSGAYSSDNVACSGGGCIYTGCKTNAECATSNPGLGLVCGGV